MSPDLETAAFGPAEDFELQPLPAPIFELLRSVNAPPRLVAHLRLVHDCAVAILGALERRWPALDVDREAVLFGAATHDIGKAVHPAELRDQGAMHERAGEELLLSAGIPAHHARFAMTHAQWNAGGSTIEDLLVSVADKVWKGARVGELEKRIAVSIAQRLSVAAWSVFDELDQVLTEIASRADARLEFQQRFPAGE